VRNDSNAKPILKLNPSRLERRRARGEGTDKDPKEKDPTSLQVAVENMMDSSQQKKLAQAWDERFIL
jgi:hypothetical protein